MSKAQICDFKMKGNRFYLFIDTEFFPFIKYWFCFYSIHF